MDECQAKRTRTNEVMCLASNLSRSEPFSFLLTPFLLPPLPPLPPPSLSIPTLARKVKSTRPKILVREPEMSILREAGVMLPSRHSYLTSAVTATLPSPPLPGPFPSILPCLPGLPLPPLQSFLLRFADDEVR
ncbi:hypothetical protein E2C01_088016 [Portunus trituberculatus]|uniref:Uncharacterized protein n=1 Tax=Portunus trituberculatus TaxID=210409 RepID=A0A5B7JEU7_PORTR|nr:hypothetical protein [Portunus trituberculatus]